LTTSRIASLAKDPPFDGRLAFGLMIIVGGLLATSVLLSKIAQGHGMPMLTYLALAMSGSGVILLSTARRGVRSTAPRGQLWGYSLVAGGLIALSNAIGYLTIHIVGAAFISLAIAFPPMVTWALSLLMGLERFSLARGLGLLIALFGGILLAAGTGRVASQATAGYILAASTIPLVLAFGNVFRTRYWPPRVDPRLLAALMLLCGGGLTFPVALWHEGPLAVSVLLETTRAGILIIAILTFAALYLLLFHLQRVAGPVYLSQIGYVAAVIGVPAAVLLLYEPLPAGFAISAVLIALGLAIFQSRRRSGTNQQA
jgi:drug/metabolite transporter (DMT)-like permease